MSCTQIIVDSSFIFASGGGGGGGGAPSGPAGGDLGGTYPNPIVDGLQGRAVANTAPTNGQAIAWNAGATQWEPKTILPTGAAGGDLSGAYPNPFVKGLQGFPVSVSAPGDGQIFVWNNGANQWEPEFPGGDLAGFHPNPIVDGLQGRFVAATAPTNDQALVWNSGMNQWEPGLTNAKRLQGQTIATTVPANDQALVWNSGSSQWEPGLTDAKELRGRTIATTVPANDQALVWNSGSSQWEPGLTDAKELQGRTIATTVPANGQALVWNSGSTQWEPQTVSASPTGAAGGDLSGTYPNPTVDALQGYPVSPTPPLVYHVLQSNGGSWVAALVTDNNIQNGGISAHLKLIDNTVTDAKLRQGAALSVIGRSANTTGNVANIAAVDGSGGVLRESGSVIGFGTIATAGIADGAITSAKLASEAAWKKYAVTLTDLVNSASETDIIKGTIPANEWADGEIITIDAILNGKNNTGSNHTITFKIYYDATSSTVLSAFSIATAATEAPWRIQVELWRVGANLFVRWGNRDSFANAASASSLRLPSAVAGGFPQSNEYTGNYGDVWVAPGFATSKELKISAQFDAADGELFMKVWAAKIWKW